MMYETTMDGIEPYVPGLSHEVVHISYLKINNHLSLICRGSLLLLVIAVRIYTLVQLLC